MHTHSMVFLSSWRRGVRVPGSTAAAAADSVGGGSSPEAPLKLHAVQCFTAPHTHLQVPQTVEPHLKKKKKRQDHCEIYDKK